MTLNEALSRARKLLTTEEGALESEVLLRHCLKISRTELYLSLSDELSPEHERKFWRLLNRRLSGEPTAYIVKNREFYGLDFYVDSRVLIPRPETEILVEKAIDFARHRQQCVTADIGTGCGAIAIALAINLPHAKIYATDVSRPALEVARHNCQRHGITSQVQLVQGDMLDAIPEPVDLLVANLPYVKESELAGISGGFEPEVALNGGTDGLDRVFRLCRQAKGKIRPDGGLLLEIGLGQREAVTSFLHDLFPSAMVEVTPDLSGIDRVVGLYLTAVVIHR